MVDDEFIRDLRAETDLKRRESIEPLPVIPVILLCLLGVTLLWVFG